MRRSLVVSVLLASVLVPAGPAAAADVVIEDEASCEGYAGLTNPIWDGRTSVCINSGGTIPVGDTVTIASGVTLFVSQGPLLIAGELVSDGALLFDGPVENRGQVTNNGEVLVGFLPTSGVYDDVGGVTDNFGNWVTDRAGHRVRDGGIFNNHGTYELVTTLDINSDSSGAAFTNKCGSTFSSAGTIVGDQPIDEPCGPVCTIEGTDGNDWLVGTRADDVICGFGGRDVLIGFRGHDTLLGGDDNDWLFGGSGDDDIFGEGGNDRLFGWFGNDDLDGGAGTDRCIPGRGNDTTVDCET